MMKLLIHHRKVEYVNTESINRMTSDQAAVFLLFMEASVRNHERAISELHDVIENVKKVHRLVNVNGTYVKEVETITGEDYPVIGGIWLTAKEKE